MANLPPINFKALAEALLRMAGELVPRWLPDGHRRGNEYVARNPMRNDRNPGSFTINLKSGVWKDYAINVGGSDLVSLYAYLYHQDDQGSAARELERTRQAN